MRKIPENSTPIIHEIIERLACIRLSTYEFNIIFAIIRKTYGWGQKDDWISLDQLSKITGIASQHCSRTLKKLLIKKIVIKNIKAIGINKQTSEWLPIQVLPKQVVPIQVFNTTQTGIQVLPKQVDTKETITKENARECLNEFWRVYPIKKEKKKCLELFQKISPELLPDILEAIKDQKIEKEFLKGGNQFCPEWKHPTTWLRGECWNDEVNLPPEEKPPDTRSMTEKFLSLTKNQNENSPPF